MKFYANDVSTFGDGDLNGIGQVSLGACLPETAESSRSGSLRQNL